MPVVKDKLTTEQHNKRQDERFSSQAPLVFSRFGNNFHREYASMMFNHSRNGVCLVAAEALRPGTTLYIRGADTAADENYDGHWKHLRTSSLGEVRCCRELKDNSVRITVSVLSISEKKFYSPSQ